MLTLPEDVVYELVGSCHSPDTELGLYQQPKDKGSDYVSTGEIKNALEDIGLYSNTDGMLSNGGRFYIDPSGPEYATPETTTAEEAVLRTFDGDKILLGVFDKLRDSGAIEGYQVNRRTVDHNRSSRGIHLNTTTTESGPEPSRKLQRQIATLNLVKGAIFGSGGLLIDENGETAFHHSPRLSLTTDIARTWNEYTQRPLVRYPFKEDGDLWRVETVTSDALTFAWPIKASLVATNALTSLIELGLGAGYQNSGALLKPHIPLANMATKNLLRQLMVTVKTFWCGR